MEFLLEGVRHGGTALYITLAETVAEVETFAASHGFKLDGVSVIEMLPAEYLKGEPQSFFHPGEVEIPEISRRIITEAERLRPSRLAIDSLSELRVSMPDTLLFHRQLTALKHVMTRLGITAVMTEPVGPGRADPHLQTVAHAVIELDVTPRFYGRERRRLRVVKMRDFDYVPGYHDYDLTRGGLRVYPRVAKAGNAEPSAAVDVISSGIPEFDTLMDGGIQRGTTTLLIGTTGTGKSSLAAQYAMAAAGRGERSLVYLFDESLNTAVLRGQGLGLPILEAVRDGLVRIEELDPAELSPGEFADRVRRGVEADGARMVVIDSLSGYLNAMPEENALVLQMHELGSDLNRRGVSTFLLLAQAGVFGGSARSTVDLSYLADTVVLFRSFEARGAVRKAISVVKKRYGAHETTIREFLLEPGHIRVGPVLHEFEGVLTGTPHFTGQTGTGALLLERTEPDDAQRR
jgi:circadian clock protein KaiC